MKRFFIILAALAGFAFPTFAQSTPTQAAGPQAATVELPGYFYKRLEGTINGSYRVVMNLMRLGDHVSGDYYYEGTGAPITFTYDSHIGNDGSVYLVEAALQPSSADAPGTSGVFRGRFTSPHELSGTWSTPDGSASYPFKLVERYPAGSIPLDLERYSASYGAARGDANIEFVFPRPITQADSGAGGAGGAASLLASEIKTALAGTYLSNNPAPQQQSIPALIDDFIARFNGLVNDPAFYGPELERWGDSFVTSVMLNEDGVLGLQNESFTYEGGAHPLTVYTYGNYETTTGKLIALDDVLASGAKPRLDALGEAALRKAYGVPEGESLTDAGFFLEGPFTLNDNFLIAHGGLLFRFNQYEIGPYVLGAPEVYLPYADLKGLLKRGGLLSALMP